MNKRQPPDGSPVLLELHADDLEILMADGIELLPCGLENCIWVSCRTSRLMAKSYTIYLDALNIVRRTVPLRNAYFFLSPL